MVLGLPIALFGLLTRTKGLCGFYIGLVFSLWTAAERLDGELHDRLEGIDLVVRGIIVGLPRDSPSSNRFRFRIQHTTGDPFNGDVLLSCYRCDQRFVPGDIWRASVRLNSPRGTVNPDLFDYESWLFTKDIMATGYIRDVDTMVRLGRHPVIAVHHRVRQRIRETLTTTIKDESLAGLLIALAIGDSTAISATQWQTLSKTGTNHLFVISGLHIGLVGSLVYKVLGLLPLPIVARSTSTLLLIGLYAALAGWGLPVQRAFVMAAVVVVARSLRRNVSATTMYCSALFAVLLIEPFAVLSIGFWLSFAAVFSLMYAFSCRRPLINGVLTSAIHTQWAVYLGMLPWMLYLLYQLSWSSFLVNIVAIPWIGIFVIPLLLRAMIVGFAMPAVGSIGIALCGKLLALIWVGIEWAAGFDLVFYRSPPTELLFAFAIVGVLVVLSPKGLLPKWPGFICLLLLFSEVPQIQSRLQVSFIDVGQGLSVLVKSASETLLYDTGMASGSFDAGEQIVSPFLRRENIKTIDHLVISHGDNDHAGGESAVARNFNIKRVITSRLGIVPGSELCHSESRWETDDLTFRLFSVADTTDGNNSSCLLHVSGVGVDVLLTGDIEVASETQLLALALPHMDLVSAPHHGSASSSTPAFLNMVRPGLAIVSAGYKNRFHHPDPFVMTRYRQRNSRVLNTADHGSVSVYFTDRLIVTLARETHPRLWYK